MAGSSIDCNKSAAPIIEWPKGCNKGQAAAVVWCGVRAGDAAGSGSEANKCSNKVGERRLQKQTERGEQVALSLRRSSLVWSGLDTRAGTEFNELLWGLFVFSSI